MLVFHVFMCVALWIVALVVYRDFIRSVSVTEITPPEIANPWKAVR